jgi:hypothetical protein
VTGQVAIARFDQQLKSNELLRQVVGVMAEQYDWRDSVGRGVMTLINWTMFEQPTDFLIIQIDYA